MKQILSLNETDIKYIVEQTILMLGDEVSEKYSPQILKRRLGQILTSNDINDDFEEYRKELIQEYKEDIEEANKRIDNIVNTVQLDFIEELEKNNLYNNLYY